MRQDMSLIYWNWMFIACGDNEKEVFAKDTSTEIVEDTAQEEQEQYFSSTTQSEQTYSLVYDRAETQMNPLKGFLTSYRWGSPTIDMPHQLEFAYISLASLIQDEGVYTFESGLEPYLQDSESRGHHTIVRVYIDYPNLQSGLPEYLSSAVSCSPYTEYGGGCAPNYQDPMLQSAIINFIKEFGARYDGDTRLAFVQLGLLGFWGEWHTYPHTDWFASDIFQQEVIETFDDVFQKTPLQIRIPVQDTSERVMGFHDDSFAYSTLGDIEWFFWSKMLAAGTELHWEHSPMGGEVFPGLQETLFSEDYLLGEYSQDFATCISQTHATYMINYKAFHEYTPEQQEQAKEISMAMGYEYTIEKMHMEIHGLRGSNIDMQLTISVRNSGIAPFYYPLTLSLWSQQGEKWIVEEHLEDLLPSAQSHDYSILLEDVPSTFIDSMLFVRLESEMIQTSQKIRFANIEDVEGQIPIAFDFSCHHEEETYMLGEKYNEYCFCDVDGVFRTAEGADCLE